MMSARSNRVKYLTVSAMLSALGVVFLSIGSLIEALDLTAAVLASLLCIYAVIEMGRAYPWAIWLVTSVLALLVLPVKAPAVIYALFFGFYPVLKEKLERLPRILCWVLKLAVFHLSLLAILGASLLFFPDYAALEGPKWLPFLIYPLLLLCFWLYDLVLTRLITFYLLRLRKHFKIK